MYIYICLPYNFNLHGVFFKPFTKAFDETLDPQNLKVPVIEMHMTSVGSFRATGRFVCWNSLNDA